MGARFSLSIAFALVLSGTALAGFCDRRVLFPPGEMVSRVEIESADSYLWDNWSYYDAKEDRYYRYSLSASKRESVVADGRHTKARIRVFTSKNGRDWADEGLIWADQLTWSGQARRSADGEFQLFVTLPDASTDKLTQKIAVARSSDGIRFTDPQVLLDPSDPRFATRAGELGYHLGDGDGIVMALRDPYAIGNDLFFAAKTIDPASGKIVPAIGHARFRGGSLSDIELLSPIRLPIEGSIHQVEVPNVLRLGENRYLMTVNLAELPPAGSKSPPRTWVRVYEGSSPSGPWKPAIGPTLDRDGTLFRPEDHVYGFNLTGGGHGVRGAGFFMPGAKHPFSLTGTIRIELGAH